ncbi:MAG: hypothetical protein ABI644_00710 [Arenimonas sp.]
MNDPNNNPYPDSSTIPANRTDPEKGTILAGFFIGWGLMIGSGLLTGFVISVLIGMSNAISDGPSFIYQIVGLISFLMPIVIVIGAMIWFGKKGKSKIVKGIGAAIISLIALAILLIAACFGLFAMNGNGFH